jgi:TldD protein
MRKVWLILPFLVLAGAVWLGAAESDDDPVVQAMRAELTRSRAELRLPDYVEPYYIAYRLRENDTFYFAAVLGAAFGQGGGRSRKIGVAVRVGDYALDNTSSRTEFEHWDPDMDTFNYLNYVDLPVDNETDAIRAQFWRLTDLRFKNALAMYLAKKGRMVYREDPDIDLPDFTREEPTIAVEPPLTIGLDKDAWRATAREASLILKEFPELLDTRAEVQVNWVTDYFLNTEGSTVVTRDFTFAFIAQASALADDGMTLNHYFTRYARSAAGIPDRADVLVGVRKMAEELVRLRVAPVLEPYTGPAILDPTVAGVFIHEAIGHRLEGDRTRGVDEGKTFKGKVGEKILPEFLDITDDPTLRRLAGLDLNGHYRFDDQGVPAQRVELVQAGTLLNFLRGRTPIPSFAKSNGHGRAALPYQPMSRMGTLIVNARRTMPLAKLKRELLKQARRDDKPYGLWLRGGMSGETATDQFNFQAFANRPVLLYRVDATTGEEELVRGAEVVGTPLLSISKVMAAGDDIGVFNGYCGAESGYVPVSAVAPSLLVREIELQRVQDKPTKPPVLAPPYAGRN